MIADIRIECKQNLYNYDIFKENLNTANNSDGALQKQADIYAKSWDAAEKRVKAAAEGIYDSLLNDDFFIKMTNGLADFLQGAEKLIDSMGGLKGILITIAPWVNKIFGQQINQNLQTMVQGVRNLFGVTKQEALQTKKESLDALSSMASDKNSSSMSKMVNILQARGKMQLQYMENESKLNATEKAIIVPKEIAITEEAVVIFICLFFTNYSI